MVGKWHLGHFSMEYMPSARGFDSFYGYLTDTIKYFQHTYVALLRHCRTLRPCLLSAPLVHMVQVPGGLPGQIVL